MRGKLSTVCQPTVDSSSECQHSCVIKAHTMYCTILYSTLYWTCTVYIVHCAVCSVLCSVQCTVQCTVYCAVYRLPCIVQCTARAVYNVLCSVLCSVHVKCTVQCTVQCTVYCTLCNMCQTSLTVLTLIMTYVEQQSVQKIEIRSEPHLLHQDPYLRVLPGSPSKGMI